jgi:hypothetical protein
LSKRNLILALFESPDSHDTNDFFCLKTV